MIQEAAADPALKQELEDRLTTLKQEVEEFIALQEIPKLAEDVHQDLVTQNEALLAEINKILENGSLALDQLENSELFTTINEATSLINRIEALGQKSIHRGAFLLWEKIFLIFSIFDKLLKLLWISEDGV
ncbi:hypothetical protein KIS1582_0401 [Cytobacillus firmus]|uniref:Uncharacterized protein n=2 Tax=Cytobacillus firmus TaxID=1399 RepID=A0A800NFM3_CYTFI|nr:hypothetical protein KIS1582_0401 [Cytobacillus firmus]